ncbi:peptidase M16 [Eggerthellaceae bacterium zg-1084]|uniref:insulinase family protein n=1 Tax=Berryella wangjianweii TaxID=2734634 RepID=UPI0015526253|nr:insulinase family protein [Berryella wangjianweii]NPD30527.1 peptidase M16 [Berryella wangjianweii]
MDLSPHAQLHGFTVEEAHDLAEIEGRAYVMRHAETGARLLYLKNDDPNKAFAIGFRTPPGDDTGVFHILEHSVLCGSDRFPVKEPFVDLLKSSMQTFLNAMTFPDKTLYPVASTNERDLLNLMDVYLDAVFHPRIFRTRAIFEQEGWHYELRSRDAAFEGDVAALDAERSELSYNGVVFNEMKGALSDPSSVLYHELQRALFPDGPYAFESGGTPRAIPTLTYEQYLEEHRRHYRVDNSYTILYGNLDIDRALAFLDERYLTPVHAEQQAADARRVREGGAPAVPRTLAPHAPVCSLDVVRPMDTAPENECAAAGYVVSPFSDPARILAADILLDALFGSNEAPAKRALLDAGLADEVVAYTADSLLQPFAVVELRGLKQDGAERLVGEVERVIGQLADEGIDPEVIEASLARAEFALRERNYGMPDGVVLSMMALSGWLYDDADALSYLRYEDALAHLHAGMTQGLFERLARELFVQNPHRARVHVRPEAPAESAEAMELAARNARLSADERRQIVRSEAELRALQEAEDDPEARASLPRLSVADLGEAPVEPPYALDEEAPLSTLRHQASTHGIVYATRYFDAGAVAFDDLPYLSVLCRVLGKLGTAHHSAAQIDVLLQGRLGSFAVRPLCVEGEHSLDARLMVEVGASSLEPNAAWIARLTRELLSETDFSDLARIRDLLQQQKIGFEQSFAAGGHSHAMERVRAYATPGGAIADRMGNVGFYRFLTELLDRFDERGAQLSARLQDIARTVFTDAGTTLSFAGSDEAYRLFWQADPLLGGCEPAATRLAVPEPRVLREAFIVPTDVSFTALGWDRRLLGEEFQGSWPVAARALTFDYLWNEVRVKGGAYGVGLRAQRGGALSFYSYRDPNLDATLERFAGAAAWIERFSPEARDLEGLVISSTAGVDAPLKPRELVKRQALRYLTGVSPARLAEVRQQMTDTTIEQVRALGATLRRAVEAQAVCTFGNRDIIEGSQAGLTAIELIGEGAARS